MNYYQLLSLYFITLNLFLNLFSQRSSICDHSTLKTPTYSSERDTAMNNIPKNYV